MFMSVVRQRQLLRAVRVTSAACRQLSSTPQQVVGLGPARDLIGYGRSPPDAKWPGGAKVAVNLVLNYEEGGENCLLDGDVQSEHLLSEIVGAAPIPNQRHANMESLYEYGSRAGFWRLHRLLTERSAPVTVYAVGLALKKHPEAAQAMADAGWEMASHGWRWIDLQHVDEATQREQMREVIALHKELYGAPPPGMYLGKPSVHSRRFLLEEHADAPLLYDSDSYADDLPYWHTDTPDGKPHLIIPYTLSENDMRFVIPNGFSHADEFASHLISTVDALVAEGEAGCPKMMSVGLRELHRLITSSHSITRA